MCKDVDSAQVFRFAPSDLSRTPVGGYAHETVLDDISGCTVLGRRIRDMYALDDPTKEVGMRNGVIAIGLLVLAGCSSAHPEPLEASPDEVAFTVGTEPDVCDGQCSPIAIDHHKSLVVTDPQILQRFPLRRVLQTLIAHAGVSNGPDAIWKQWWMSQGMNPGSAPPHWNFCDDPSPFPTQIRDFPFECPRAEEQLAHHLLDDHRPIALVNRFDLAPMDGAHCGEYRIVYAKSPGSPPGGENLIIFEGVLRNPNPDCGLAGCLPVAEFWQSLSTEPNVNLRADHLERFYFGGICGFPAVIRPEHYGANCRGGGGYGGGCGQIRTNQFVQAPWNLREFRLEIDCSTGTCELMVRQQPVAQNPHVDLWDSSDLHYPAFKADLLGQLASNLPMPDSIHLFAADTDPIMNASESIAQPGPGMNVYDADPVFEADINLAISSLAGSPVATAVDIEQRLTVQSCGGCHELSNGAAIGETSGGPSLIWPPSMGFKHIDHFGALSPAMINDFLPWREQVLHAFLSTSCGHNCFGQNADVVVVKDVEVVAGDRLPSIRFDLLTWDEWLQVADRYPLFDTLSGARTH